MRLSLMVLALVGVTACTRPSDAAFCGPTYSGAVDRLGKEALAHKATPEALGNAVADVVTGHKAGCVK